MWHSTTLITLAREQLLHDGLPQRVPRPKKRKRGGVDGLALAGDCHNKHCGVDFTQCSCGRVTRERGFISGAIHVTLLLYLVDDGPLVYDQKEDTEKNKKNRVRYPDELYDVSQTGSPRIST